MSSDELFPGFLAISFINSRVFSERWSIFNMCNISFLVNNSMLENVKIDNKALYQ